MAKQGLAVPLDFGKLSKDDIDNVITLFPALKEKILEEQKKYHIQQQSTVIRTINGALKAMIGIDGKAQSILGEIWTIDFEQFKAQREAVEKFATDNKISLDGPAPKGRGGIGSTSESADPVKSKEKNIKWKYAGSSGARERFPALYEGVPEGGNAYDQMKPEEYAFLEEHGIDWHQWD